MRHQEESSKDQKWHKEIRNFMDNFYGRISSLSSADKEKEIIALEEAFTKALAELKDQVSQVEYGRHVEGLYGMSTREEYSNHSGMKFKR